MNDRIAVFDLGKVLLDFDYGVALRQLARHVSHRSDRQLRAWLLETPMLERYETGLMTSREFFDQFAAAHGFQGTYETFRRVFADIFTPIPEMIELHARLRRRGVRTCIFSNTNEIAIAQIRDRFPFYRDFEWHVLSYEERLMKPAPGIYAALERRTGARAERLCYLDDRPENVDAARACGWQAAVHVSPEHSAAALRGWGLLPQDDAPPHAR